MSENTIDASSVSRVSQGLLGASLLLGLFTTYRLHKMSAVMGELFQGMNIDLPVLTKLFLSPLSRVVVPTVLVALILKELSLKDRPVLSLALNAAGLVAIIVIHEFFAYAGISPMLTLLENLGG